MINGKAIQAPADAHRQNSLCGKAITLKNTQTFLVFIHASWSLSESQIFRY